MMRVQGINENECWNNRMWCRGVCICTAMDTGIGSASLSKRRGLNGPNCNKDSVRAERETPPCHEVSINAASQRKSRVRTWEHYQALEKQSPLGGTRESSRSSSHPLHWIAARRYPPPAQQQIGLQLIRPERIAGSWLQAAIGSQNLLLRPARRLYRQPGVRQQRGRWQLMKIQQGSLLYHRGPGLKRSRRAVVLPEVTIKVVKVPSE